MTLTRPQIGLSASVLAAAVVGWLARPYMGLATLSYGILLTGVFATLRGSKLHANLMSLGVAADIAQVLWIELSRGAIAETLRMELPPLPLLHVITSALAVVCYAPALWLGKRAFKTKPGHPARKIHRAFGIAALSLRTVGFLLMFSLISYLATRTPPL